MSDLEAIGRVILLVVLAVSSLGLLIIRHARAREDPDNN